MEEKTKTINLKTIREKKNTNLTVSKPV